MACNRRISRQKSFAAWSYSPSIEGHNLREVGLLLGLPEGTVKSRLFLARKELKERLS